MPLDVFEAMIGTRDREMQEATFNLCWKRKLEREQSSDICIYERLPAHATM
jgi:hypothetical protein